MIGVIQVTIFLSVYQECLDFFAGRRLELNYDRINA